MILYNIIQNVVVLFLAYKRVNETVSPLLKSYQSNLMARCSFSRVYRKCTEQETGLLFIADLLWPFRPLRLFGWQAVGHKENIHCDADTGSV